MSKNTIKYNTLKDYIKVQLELFLLLIVQDKYLRKQEKKVFIEFVIASIEGYDINSKECNDLVAERLGYKYTLDVLQYKSILYRKEWFKKDKNDNYYLIPNFNYSNKKFNRLKNYSFTLELINK